MTTADAIKLRDTLRTLKQAGAVEGDTQLAYATDKTLRTLEGELQVYEETKRKKIAEYSRTDEKGRRLVKSGGDLVAVEENDQHEIVGAYEPDTDDPIPPQILDSQMENQLEDAAALQKELQEVRGREVENLHLHQVSRERFFKHADLNGIHGQVDLVLLDPWLKGDQSR